MKVVLGDKFRWHWNGKTYEAEGWDSPGVMRLRYGELTALAREDDLTDPKGYWDWVEKASRGKDPSTRSPGTP